MTLVFWFPCRATCVRFLVPVRRIVREKVAWLNIVVVSYDGPQQQCCVVPVFPLDLKSVFILRVLRNHRFREVFLYSSR